MSSITRTQPAGTITEDQLDLLTAELTDATGVVCLGVQITRGADLAGDPDPSTDQVTVVFDGDPDPTDVDTALAAHPTITPGATGSFAVSANTTYKIFEARLAPGEHIALDIHVHAVMGSAANADPVFVDYYSTAWRQTVGDVKVSQPIGTKSGQIPGFDVLVVGGPTSVQVQVQTRKAGTLVLMLNDVEIASRGMLS